MSSSSIPLQTPRQIDIDYPIPPFYKGAVLRKRKMAEHLLRGKDPRLVIFAGPCSIHDREMTLHYALLMQKLDRKVADRIFLVMRVFLEKPRTHFGWKGFLYDPHLDGTYQIDEGLVRARELLVELVKIGVPLATEFLDPLLLYYHRDFFTWGIIGARTSASQVHRQIASYLDLPIGFKNETDGMLDNAICGALVARHPQVFIGIDEHGKVSMIRSQGNPHTHLILRGSCARPNYDPLSVAQAMQRQSTYGLHAPLIIDCAHGNSQKQYREQVTVFGSVLDQITQGNRTILGAMLESHIQGGHTCSVTDPCLDWATTEDLILRAHSMLGSSVCTRSNRSSPCRIV